LLYPNELRPPLGNLSYSIAKTMIENEIAIGQRLNSDKMWKSFPHLSEKDRRESSLHICR
jgi:hypothetical protein